MALWVGTSGWQYRDWRRAFYPHKLPQKAWLEHYAERFATVEVNNTFYRLPPDTTFAQWAQRTPDDFLIGAKLSRYLSHIKRLKDPQEPIQRFLERAKPLGRKVGPILLQLPPNFQADVPLLADALALWPREIRLAFEPRHETWYTDDLAELLRRYDVALCLADREDQLMGPLWRTASWGYVRLHWGIAPPRPCYSEETLQRWVVRIAELYSPEDDVFVYFNNDPECCAVRDSIRFASMAAEAGLRPTRTPRLDEVRVGGFRDAA